MDEILEENGVDMEVSAEEVVLEPVNEEVSLDQTAEETMSEEVVSEIVSETTSIESNITLEAEDEINDVLAEPAREDMVSDAEVIAAKNSPDCKWYALHTFTGYEQAVQENLVLTVDKYNLQKRVFDVIIPEEEVMEEKNGKRKIFKRKQMPGYVLVKMIYADDIWHAITRTRGVTGFVGPKGRPLPLSNAEVARLRLEQVKVEVDLEVNDRVQIVSGPLENLTATIVAIDLINQKLKASVEMFGRSMPVELDLTQVRRI